MNAIHRFVLLLLFVTCFLCGAQIPNFLDQYEKRIDIHYREANENHSGFQQIADMFFNGSMEALIKKHEASTDPVFKSEAEPLRNLFARKTRFERELQALQTTFVKKAWHVALEGDREILDETYRNYLPGFPLHSNAILSGLTLALMLTIFFELMVVLVRGMIRRGRQVVHAG